jgi:hypothetical protein
MRKFGFIGNLCIYSGFIDDFSTILDGLSEWGGPRRVLVAGGGKDVEFAEKTQRSRKKRAGWFGLSW